MSETSCKSLFSSKSFIIPLNRKTLGEITPGIKVASLALLWIIFQSETLERLLSGNIDPVLAADAGNKKASVFLVRPVALKYYRCGNRIWLCS